MSDVQRSEMGTPGSEEHRQDRKVSDVRRNRKGVEMNDLLSAIIVAGSLINSHAPPAVPLASPAVVVPVSEDDPTWQEFQAEDNGRAAERRSGRGRPEGVYDDLRQDEYDKEMNWRLRRSDDDNRREREYNERGRPDD